MGKLFWQISTTIDGYMEDADGKLEMTAGFHDEDFDRYASEMLDSIGAFIIGRKTYELFVDYWPKATGKDADNMNNLPKYVVSRTLETIDWETATLIGANAAEAIAAIKNGSDGDLAIFGSSELAAELAPKGIIDEYRIFITPCLLGTGGRAFKDGIEARPLRLIRSETWSSGTTAQFYQLQTNSN